jgi:hypothetical protein
MLPLLPALILLLLNGPANIERMAEVGALPAALAAIQHRIDSGETVSLSQARADQFALASLLSLSGDPQISHALARLLISDLGSRTTDLGESDVAPASRLVELESLGSNQISPIRDPQSEFPQDGFADSQRSRDGPFAG